LLDGIRSGQSPFEQAHGVGSWGYMAAHPELGTTFNEFMTRLTAGRHEALLAAYDFGGIGTLVDVGGGSGATLAAVLRAHPGMRAILFDLPQGLGDAAAVLAAAGVADRCGIVEGDFFAAVPPGGDAYILSRILHDWDDARAGAILRSCHRAMGPGGRLLVLESVLPPPPARLPPAVAFLDLDMHVMEGGRERTEADFAALFATTGFELTRMVPLPPHGSLLEAVRR
jgi:SAM-dependent methyltransferase